MGTWPAYNAREIEFRLLKVAGTEEEVVSDMSTHRDHLEAAHVRHRTLSPQLALVEIVQERLPGWSARRCVVKVVTAEQLLEPVIDHTLTGEPVHAVEVEVDEQLRLVMLEHPTDEVHRYVPVAERVYERVQGNQALDPSQHLFGQLAEGPILGPHFHVLWPRTPPRR